MTSGTNNLVEHLENYNVENTALHRKLHTNVEVIRILRRDLDKYRTERDQFKLMAETLQMRYSAMKKSLYSSGGDQFTESSSSTLLNEMRERNMRLSTELGRTKEKLLEKQGDIQVLREEKKDLVSRLELQDQSRSKSTSALQDAERQDFISQLEALKRTNAQLKFDLHTMVDDKSELFTEMEAYKAKAHRLQEELTVTSRGNMLESAKEIDNLLRENSQLKERQNSLEKDLEMSREIIIKYKKYVEAHRKDAQGDANTSGDSTN